MFIFLTHGVFSTVLCTDGDNTIQRMVKKLINPCARYLEEISGTMTLIGNLPLRGNETIAMPEKFTVTSKERHCIQYLSLVDCTYLSFTFVCVVGDLKPTLSAQTHDTLQSTDS